MKHLGFGKAALLLIVAAVAAGGCWPMEKMGYVSIKRKYNPLADQLQNTNAEKSRLMMDLNAIGDENRNLRLQGKTYLVELAESKSHITDLEQQLKERQDVGSVDPRLAAIIDDLKRLTGVEYRPQNNSLILRVQFDLGKADVKPAGKRLLAKVASKLKTVEPGYVIYIDGHTDDLPVVKPATRAIYTDLWGLGASRSLAVLRTLRAYGVSSNRMISRSFADRDPLVPGHSPSDRKRNRRVEISIAPRPASARVVSIQNR